MRRDRDWRAVTTTAPNGGSPRPSPSTRLRDNRDFRIVLVGQGISALGDAITFTALPLMVVALTGSGVAMGTVGVLQTLPDLIFGLPAGAFADRHDRRRLIMGADIGRALLTALIPLAYMLGWSPLAVILAVTFPLNALRVVFLAAWTAAIPSLVGRDQVGRANGTAEAIFSLSFIIGPAIAGLLISAIGPGPTLAIDAASFLVSATSIYFVRRPLQKERAPKTTHIVTDIVEGLRYIAGQRTLRVTIAFWTIFSVLTAPLVPAVIFFLTIDRSASSEVVGLVLSGYGVGYLVGALVAARLARGRLGRMMLISGVSLAPILVIFALASQPIVQALMTFAAGVTGALGLLSYLTLRATIPPDELLGRVGSTARTLSLGLSPIGIFAAGICLDAIGGQATIVLLSVLIVAACAGFSLSHELRHAVARTSTSVPAASVSAARASRLPREGWRGCARLGFHAHASRHAGTSRPGPAAAHHRRARRSVRRAARPAPAGASAAG